MFCSAFRCGRLLNNYIIRASGTQIAHRNANYLSASELKQELTNKHGSNGEMHNIVRIGIIIIINNKISSIGIRYSVQ
jgi:hypothetical protein